MGPVPPKPEDIGLALLPFTPLNKAHLQRIEGGPGLDPCRIKHFPSPGYCYMDRRDEEMQQHARNLNIRLVFIAPGETGQVQPSDWCAFGVLTLLPRAGFDRRLVLGEVRPPRWRQPSRI